MKIKIDFVGVSLAWEMACMEMTVMVAVPNVVIGSKLNNPQFLYCNNINFLSHKKSILKNFLNFPYMCLVKLILLILICFSIPTSLLLEVTLSFSCERVNVHITSYNEMSIFCERGSFNISIK